MHLYPLFISHYFIQCILLVLLPNSTTNYGIKIILTLNYMAYHKARRPTAHKYLDEQVVAIRQLMRLKAIGTKTALKILRIFT